MAKWHSILEAQNGNDPPPLTVNDAVVIYSEAPFNDLLFVANERRKTQVPGNIVTYLVDRNINYTNVCTINCHFCSFYRPPGHSENYTQTYEQICDRVQELVEIGGSRILMQGGVNPDIDLGWYTGLLREISERFPNISLDCFSPIEIEGISDISRMSTKEVLAELQSAGLHGLPGGGAEILVDEVRFGVSPIKGSSENWLRVMGEAQELGLVTSATNVFGFGESLLQRVQHMEKIRNLQQSSLSMGNPGFTSFISWPVMLENNTFGKMNRGSNREKLAAGSVEYLRHVAISRLFLHNINHIQASWPTMGMSIAQMALNAGADDIGSTMMEENVVSASGTSKTEATIFELESAIIGAGFIPAKRDSEYRILEYEGSLSSVV